MPQAAAVLLFHDAAREGEADPPAPGLRGGPGLEQPGPHLGRHAGPVVAHGHARHPACRLDPRLDRASIAFLSTASMAHSMSTGSPSAFGPGPLAVRARVTGLASVGRRGRK